MSHGFTFGGWRIKRRKEEEDKDKGGDLEEMHLDEQKMMMYGALLPDAQPLPNTVACKRAMIQTGEAYLGEYSWY